MLNGKFIVLINLLSILSTHGKIFEGSFDDATFGYMGKFVFGFDERNNVNHSAGTEGEIPIGEIILHIEGANIEPDLRFYLFSFNDNDVNGAHGWNSIYNNGLSCSQITAKAKKMINGGAPSEEPGIPVEPHDSPSCRQSPCFHHEHTLYLSDGPTYWYAALARDGDCDSMRTSIPAYYLIFNNIQVDGSLTTLSYGEESFEILFITLSIIWLISLVIHFKGHASTLFSKYQSPIVRYFHISCVLMELSLICGTFHWIISAWRGIDAYKFASFSQFLLLIGSSIMWLKISLLGLGFGITRTAIISDIHIEDKYLYEILPAFAFVALNCITHALYVFAKDPGTTFYFYDNWMGFCSLIIQITFAIWWYRQLRMIHDVEATATKRSFYKVTGVIYIAWLLSTPVIVAIGWIFSVWLRCIFTHICILGMNTLVYLLTMLLLWPANTKDILVSRAPHNSEAQLNYSFNGYSDL